MPILSHKLNSFVRFYGSLVPHTLTGADYADFAEMKADHSATGKIKVNVNHSTGTIFGDPTINWLFRAWHDSCHLIADAGFDSRGEYRAYVAMVKQLADHPDVTSEDLEEFSNILHAEIVGQGQFYIANGDFPADQYVFTRDYINGCLPKLAYEAERTFPVYLPWY